MSVVEAVGFIALAGVAAETGVVMLIYLDHALADIAAQRKAKGHDLSLTDLYAATIEAGAAQNDDGGGDHGEAPPHPVERRRGAGCDETDRRATDWRNVFLRHTHARRDSCRLFAIETPRTCPHGHRVSPIRRFTNLAQCFYWRAKHGVR